MFAVGQLHSPKVFILQLIPGFFRQQGPNLVSPEVMGLDFGFCLHQIGGSPHCSDAIYFLWDHVQEGICPIPDLYHGGDFHGPPDRNLMSHKLQESNWLLTQTEIQFLLTRISVSDPECKMWTSLACRFSHKLSWVVSSECSGTLQPDLSS